MTTWFHDWARLPWWCWLVGYLGYKHVACSWRPANWFRVRCGAGEPNVSYQFDIISPKLWFFVNFPVLLFIVNGLFQPRVKNVQKICLSSYCQLNLERFLFIVFLISVFQDLFWPGQQKSLTECCIYEALHRLDYTSGSWRWKKSSSNIFDCDNLNLGVKMTARMRAFRIYPILPHLKPFS